MRGNNDWLDVLETRQYLAHSFKGTTWGKHKYVDIKNGKYIYPEDLKAQRRASNRRSESGSVLRQRAAANYSSSQGRSMARRAEQARAQAERRARAQSAARSSAPEQPKSKNLFDSMGKRIGQAGQAVANAGASALNAGRGAAKAAGEGLNKLGGAISTGVSNAAEVITGDKARKGYTETRDRWHQTHEGMSKSWERLQDSERRLKEAKASGDTNAISKAEADHKKARNDFYMHYQENNDARDRFDRASENYVKNPGLIGDAEDRYVSYQTTSGDWAPITDMHDAKNAYRERVKQEAKDRVNEFIDQNITGKSAAKEAYENRRTAKDRSETAEDLDKSASNWAREHVKNPNGPHPSMKYALYDSQQANAYRNEADKFNAAADEAQQRYDRSLAGRFDSFTNGIQNAAGEAANAVGNAAKGAVGAAGNALNAAGEGAKNLFNAAGQRISGAYGAARDAAGNAVDAVGDAARGAYNAITGADNRVAYDRANERLASINEGQGDAYERSYYAKRDLENARQSGDQERIRQAEAAYRQAENNRIMMDQEHGDAVDAARTAAQNYANNPGLFYDRNYVDAPYHDLIRARTFGDRVNEAKDAAATAVNSTINGVADAAGNLFDQAGKRIGGMLGIESKEDRNRREMARNSAIAEGDRRDFNDRQMALMEATNRYDKALADREAARRNLGMTRADIDSSLRDYNDAEYNVAQNRFEGIRNGQSLASAQSDLNTISQQMNSAQQALRYAMGTGDQSRISFAQNALRELQSRYDDALNRAQSAQGAYDRSVQAYAQARNDYDTRYPSVPTGSTREPRQVMSEAQAAYDAADRKFRDAENAYMPIYNDYLDNYPNQNSDPFYLLPGYANGDEIRDWYRNKGRR